jgi:pilus assembly protein CpaE
MSGSQPLLTCAVVSTDPELRDAVALLARGPDAVLRVATAVDLPYAQIRDPQLQAIRQSDAELVILDLEDDPAMGIRFLQFLGETLPGRTLVAAGPVLPSDQLLAAMKAGMQDFLPKPLDEEQLRATVQRLRRRQGGVAAERAPGQLLTVFGAKGGAGCTTVAANLAVLLHRMTGKKTLLLDLDTELGEAAVHLGMQPRFSFVDLVRNFHRMDADLLASYIERHESGVHLLSAPLQPERPESVAADQLRGVVAFLRQHYDWVVADAPRSFASAATVALEQADRVLLVATIDLPTLRNIKRSLPLLDRLTGHATEKVELVVNRYQATDPITLDEVEKTLGMAAAHTLANDYDAVSGAINSGRPVAGNPSSPFARDLRELAARLAGIASPNGKPRFGPISRLFARRAEAKSHA